MSDITLTVITGNEISLSILDSTEIPVEIHEGAPGLKGDAATIVVGTVTTVPITSPATVTNVGTTGDAIFNFEIPATGVDATEIAVTPSGNLSSTNAQSALVEIQTDLDAHKADTANPHTTTHAQLSDKGTNDHAAIDAHLASTANPHSVTAAQAGAEPANANIQAHIASTANPHSVTSTQVGKDTAQWNADKILGVAIDDTAKADQKALKYDAASGKLIYGTAGGGLPVGGSANQVVGKNAANNDAEYKTIQGTTDQVDVTHGVGTITLSLPVALPKRFKSDLAFNGTDTTKTVDVSATITAASEAIWQLKDNTNNFEILGVKITNPTETSVYIESDPPLAAGNYKLVGIQ